MIAILDRRGGLIACNGAFESTLRTDTLIIRDPKGVLSFPTPADQQQFEAALKTAAPVAFFAKEHRREPMIVGIYPMKQPGATIPTSIASDFIGENGALLMWLRPKKAEEVSLQFLQTLFGLTRAEIRVAEYVVQGLALEEIAEKIGVSKITARNQLTSAMSKVGVNRQAQLVTLILNVMPRLRSA